MAHRALVKNTCFNFLNKIVSHVNKEIAYTYEDITHGKPKIYLKK
jgi:hypothetical protein